MRWNRSSSCLRIAVAQRPEVHISDVCARRSVLDLLTHFWRSLRGKFALHFKRIAPLAVARDLDRVAQRVKLAVQDRDSILRPRDELHFLRAEIAVRSLRRFDDPVDEFRSLVDFCFSSRPNIASVAVVPTGNPFVNGETPR